MNRPGKANKAANAGCRVAADIGGTFTDISFLAPDGTLATSKLLSTPRNYADAVIQGITDLARKTGLPLDDVREVLHGCTIATNAILEHKGARTALITTSGFRDVLELRRVRVPRLYDPLWQKPPPLVPRHLRFEVDERVGAKGDIVRALNEDDVRAAIETIREAGAEAVAVCLINSFANPGHERRIGDILRRELPDRFISLSVDVLPQIREYERTSTTVINCYVGPPVKAYLESMIDQLSDAGVTGRLMIMQSSGGVLDAGAVLDRPAQIIECGPAAGVIGARTIGGQCGYDNIITFDMGGTTAKASIIEHGALTVSDEYEVGAGMSTANALVNGGGYALKLPVIDLCEVGAGGGSIVRLDKAGSIKVGPDSAGALPGPACYGLGGTEPTVTDANVVLGFVNPVALAGGAVPIDAAAAYNAVKRHIADPLGRQAMETAWGIHLVANANIMRIVKAVTTYRGRDPRDFSLFAFGGSGGVHAVSLARELRIGRVVVPAAAGVFSTVGLLHADLELNESCAVLKPLEGMPRDTAEAIYNDLADGIADRLRQPRGAVSFQRFADLRYVGQAFELTVPLADGALDDAGLAELSRRFDSEHEIRYGHSFEGQYPVEIVNLRLVGKFVANTGRTIKPAVTVAREESERPVYFGPEAGECRTAVIERAALAAKPRRGPLVIEEDEATIVVPPDAEAGIDEHGNIVIELLPGEGGSA